MPRHPRKEKKWETSSLAAINPASMLPQTTRASSAFQLRGAFGIPPAFGFLIRATPQLQNMLSHHGHEIFDSPFTALARSRICGFERYISAILPPELEQPEEPAAQL